MTEKNRVDVKIAGKDYTLVGAEADEYMQKIGLYIDKKMGEIMKNNNKLSTSLAAVLTAVNVADDYFKSHENELHFKKELKQTGEELDKVKNDYKRLTEENTALISKNTSLQLELAKREAELNEVRNSFNKAVKSRE